ncbi:hypothetical protein GV818_21665 [Pseudomonas sp. Fl4BN1]|nr:hypothetical protein [Pseudomonas sp. Fl4BN1]
MGWLLDCRWAVARMNEAVEWRYWTLLSRAGIRRVKTSVGVSGKCLWQE